MNVRLSLLFSHDKIEDIYFGENTGEIISPSQYLIIKVYVMLIYFIIVHINLFYLVKVVSARFSKVKLGFSPNYFFFLRFQTVNLFNRFCNLDSDFCFIEVICTYMKCIAPKYTV